MSYRRVETTVPDHVESQTEEIIRAKLLEFDVLHAEQLQKHKGTGTLTVTFCINLFPHQVCEFVGKLQDYGVGTRFGSCTILTVAAALPPPPTPGTSQRLRRNLTTGEWAQEPSQESKSRLSRGMNWIRTFGRERLSVEEIRCQIEDGLTFTFNFIVMLVGGAVIAAGGFATDSQVMVVARCVPLACGLCLLLRWSHALTRPCPTLLCSMLVSPLMGPVLGVVFGFSTGDRAMLVRGLRNEAKSILVVLLVSFLCGAFMSCHPHKTISPKAKIVPW